MNKLFGTDGIRRTGKRLPDDSRDPLKMGPLSVAISAQAATGFAPRRFGKEHAPFGL